MVAAAQAAPQAEGVERMSKKLTEGQWAHQTARRANARAARYGAKGRITGQDWLALIEQQGGRCVYCGQEPPAGERLTVDHVRALAQHGSNDLGNIRAACRTCNAAKGDLLPSQYLFLRNCWLRRRGMIVGPTPAEAVLIQSALAQLERLDEQRRRREVAA